MHQVSSKTISSRIQLRYGVWCLVILKKLSWNVGMIKWVKMNIFLLEELEEISYSLKVKIIYCQLLDTSLGVQQCIVSTFPRRSLLFKLLHGIKVCLDEYEIFLQIVYNGDDSNKPPMSTSNIEMNNL